MKLYPHQEIAVSKGSEILKQYHLLYLAGEVRTGKTFTSLSIANNLNYSNVLVVTRKKAISSIEKDIATLSPAYQSTVINYESVHKLTDPKSFDLVILDEVHNCFLPQTIVDGKTISSYQIGDIINSYAEESKSIEKSKIIAIHKSALNENLVEIACGGEKIICTESHLIRTKRGWVKAKNITNEDELFVVW